MTCRSRWGEVEAERGVGDEAKSRSTKEHAPAHSAGKSSAGESG